MDHSTVPITTYGYLFLYGYFYDWTTVEIKAHFSKHRPFFLIRFSRSPPKGARCAPASVNMVQANPIGFWGSPGMRIFRNYVTEWVRNTALEIPKVLCSFHLYHLAGIEEENPVCSLWWLYAEVLSQNFYVQFIHYRRRRKKNAFKCCNKCKKI